MLCNIRVLDPACGTGNFLYVALEMVKRLEGEVLEALADLGGMEALTGLESHTVDPHQFLGIEINPRAAAIAELVQASQQATAARSPSHNRGRRRRSQLGRFAKRGSISALAVAAVKAGIRRMGLMMIPEQMDRWCRSL